MPKTGSASHATPFPAPQGETVIGLSAIIVAVTDEVPRVLTVSRAAHALATPRQLGEPASDADSPVALPYGPFEPRRHRTLELGLHDWVARQTGLDLGYVEQLYTFGDRFRDPRERAGGPRVVSVGYLALVRQAPLSGSGEAAWRNWYEFLPWEDWRAGRPALIDAHIRPRLEAWAAALPDAAARSRAHERIALAFGLNDAAWDFERTLERYELLYEAGLIAEALRDRQIVQRLGGCGETFDAEALTETAALGASMALDNRRILATALGRIRGKLKYRPVVFELLPPTFTLLRLQRTVEALSGVRLHKQNFRRLVISGGLVEATGRQSTPPRGRPAELYRFRREVLRERTAPGICLSTTRPGG